MNLDITKLKQETLMDIVQNVHEGAVCLEEIINVVGAPSRKEYTVKAGSKPIGPTAFSEEKAWVYAAQVVMHLLFIPR
jgi:hypothetical protein